MKQQSTDENLSRPNAPQLHGATYFSDEGIDDGEAWDELAAPSPPTRPAALILPSTDIFCPVGTASNANAPRPEDDAGDSISIGDESPDRSDEIIIEKNKYLDNIDRGTETNSEGGGDGAVTAFGSISQKILATGSLGQRTSAKQKLPDATGTGKNTDPNVSHDRRIHSSGAEHSREFIKIADLFDNVNESTNEVPSSFNSYSYVLGKVKDICGDSTNGSAYEVLTSSSENGANDENIIETGSAWTKQKSSPDCVDVGAVQMDDQAPQLNRRFFRRMDTDPTIVRNRMSRRASMRGGGQGNDDGDAQMERGAIGGSGQEAQTPPHSCQRPPSSGAGTPGGISGAPQSINRMNTQETLVEATLVEEHEGEVVEAQKMGFFERRGKVCGPALVVVVVILVVYASLQGRKSGSQGAAEDSTAMVQKNMPSFQPSMQPSSPPSFDPRPTLEIVQARGHVRCGLHIYDAILKTGVSFELCRSIAAVLLGDPDSIETAQGSFQKLKDREFDVLLTRESHTIEREIIEVSTGVGFAFSTPYFYDGVSYVGNKSYVECAENQRRYEACSSLRICVYKGSKGHELVQSSFPSDFWMFDPSITYDLMRNKTCNVATADRSILLLETGQIWDIGMVVGKKSFSTVPLAAVTRRDDTEFSNLINLVVNTLFYGEEKGLTMNSSLCGKDANLTGRASDLNFLNAVFCVGNYGELYGGQDRRTMNQVNNGSTGMLYAIPFGDLEAQYDEQLSGGTRLGDIRKQGSLKCGVVVPLGDTENVTDSKGLVGMSVDYCRTLAAALFNGNYKAVEVLTFPENDGSSFAALRNGTIDALAGGSTQWKHHFKISSSIGGFHFSSPYYYENGATDDDLSFFSMVTREEDALFSSFVECIVSSTIYAAEYYIMKEKSKDMPLTSLFGGEFNWALRDGISYSGSYDEMYEKNFVGAAKDNRGRNALNRKTGPQIRSFPGLDVVLLHQSGYAGDEGPF